MWSVLLLVLLLLPNLSQAKTIWVAASGGNNGNSCTAAQNSTSALATIGAGITCLTSGDTLIVKSGTYAEAIKDTIPAGTTGAPTTVKSEVQYGAVIKPFCSGSPGPTGCNNVLYSNCTIVAMEQSHIVFDGFTVDGANSGAGCTILIDAGGYNTASNPVTDILVQNNDVVGHCPDINSGSNCLGMSTGSFTDHVTIRGNKFHEIGWGAHVNCNWSNVVGCFSFNAYCTYLTFHDSIIENNEMYNCSGYAMQMWSSGSAENPNGTDRNIIRNNYAHDVGLSCWFSSSGDSSQVYNNIAVNCGNFVDTSTTPPTTTMISGAARGLALGGAGLSTTNLKAHYNTVVGATGYCVSSAIDAGGIVRDTICSQNGTDGINTVSGVTPVADHNLCSVLSTGCTSAADPKFVNPATRDYHLQAGSPAIDNGICVSGITTDKDGVLRPQPAGGACDIGAYEGTGGVTIPPPTPSLLAWWKLNDGTGTSAADATGNGHTATWTTGLTWQPGKVGSKSLGCDGVNATTVTGGLPTTAPYSYVFWIQGTTTPPTSGNNQIVVHNGDTSDSFGFAWGSPTTGFDQAAYTQDASGNYIAVRLTTPLQAGQWYHVGVTFDNTTLRIYLNGVQQSTAAVTTMKGATGDFHFCGTPAGTSTYFAGQLDEVKVWNYALTAAQVLQEYRSTVASVRHRSVHP